LKKERAEKRDVVVVELSRNGKKEDGEG